MKATSKYGSAYPHAAPSNATRMINRRKTVVSESVKQAGARNKPADVNVLPPPASAK